MVGLFLSVTPLVILLSPSRSKTLLAEATREVSRQSSIVTFQVSLQSFWFFKAFLTNMTLIDSTIKMKCIVMFKAIIDAETLRTQVT